MQNDANVSDVSYVGFGTFWDTRPHWAPPGQTSHRRRKRPAQTTRNPETKVTKVTKQFTEFHAFNFSPCISLNALNSLPVLS
jgi:hypothetical protein